MTADPLAGLDQFEADLWKIADNLRANSRWKPPFAHVTVESLVHARQSDYYDAIRDSSAHGESIPFIASSHSILRK